jgi:TctA family transporter
MIGFVLSMPGELKYSNEIRFSFGIDDMAYGIPLFPVLIAFVIVPSLFKKVSDVDTNKKLLINDTSIKKNGSIFY